MTSALKKVASWTLLSVVFVYVCFAAASISTPSSAPASEFVRVILLGATGNLAAKYLWVASFRLALQAQELQTHQYEFFAAASNTQELGNQWKAKFFDEAFLSRVCGGEVESLAHAQCAHFFHERFLPSVQYAPLRSEAQYQQLAATLAQQDALLSATQSEVPRVEVGRLVYLAIPPSVFAQSIELANKYLRPPGERKSGTSPFFRVIIEKPFGTDLESAQELQTQLHKSLKNDEIFLIDHYAGKAVVQALGEYFERNHEQLHPKWSSTHISKIEVRMAETETCESRIQYFHSTGIIRDVMANHLQLLLGIAVAPSFPKLSLPPKQQRQGDLELEVAHTLRQRLAFSESLARASGDGGELLLGQYEDYALHYKLETGRDLFFPGENDGRTSADGAARDHPAPKFAPTAALVALQSSLSDWNRTKFVLSVVKAANERRLDLRIHFEGNATAMNGETGKECELLVTIQTRKNEERRKSERIEWTCAFLDGLRAPQGWELDSSSHRVMVPSSRSSSTASQEHDLKLWQLGDQQSAYDVLLFEASIGNRRHFASMQEAVASWTLWTPIVQHVERAVPSSLLSESQVPVVGNPQSSRPSFVVYRTGSTAWYTDSSVIESEPENATHEAKPDEEAPRDEL